MQRPRPLPSPRPVLLLACPAVDGGWRTL